MSDIDHVCPNCPNDVEYAGDLCEVCELDEKRSAEIAKLRADHAALAEAARALVEALPKCWCGEPATLVSPDWDAECDEHRSRAHDHLPDCKWAAPLRALTALLSGAPSDYGQRVEAMRKALEPFALLSPAYGTRTIDEEIVAEECRIRIRVKHLRAAKAALEAWEGPK